MDELLLTTARDAALAAGGMIRGHFEKELNVDSAEAHDIKLELDRQSQALIESLILGTFPDHAIYGEEGIRGDQTAADQWIIDPIDGTVNFFYGIPHFAVSIAHRHDGVLTTGVIYQPMTDEMWVASRNTGRVTLNGRPIRVSSRTKLSDAIVAVGVSKTETAIEKGLPILGQMMRSARKTRMMGSAALDIAYVASGRLDAYIESQISLWDIAAGMLMVELAGGKVDLRPHDTIADKYSCVACGGGIAFTHL
ncbi:MAG: inositol monophosphatase family protein [Chthoniobacterales bacterium]|nr:inositol monophosphatase family protein [Chthoniobacterales bacterium]